MARTGKRHTTIDWSIWGYRILGFMLGIIGSTWLLGRYMDIWDKISSVHWLQWGIGGVLVVAFLLLYFWAAKVVYMIQGVIAGIFISWLIGLILTAYDIDWHGLFDVVKFTLGRCEIRLR